MSDTGILIPGVYAPSMTIPGVYAPNMTIPGVFEVHPMRDAVLAYIASLAETKVLLGQRFYSGDSDHTYFPIPVTSSYVMEIDGLYALTGKYPALIGSGFEYGQTSAEVTAMLDYLIAYWNDGGLVTLDFFPGNPWTGGGCDDRTGLNLTALITPGGSGNAAWMTYLSSIADSLDILKAAGVVVIWRPFMEVNSSGSWWALLYLDTNYAEYVALWRHMHDYFTVTRGLDNLLWLYAPAAEPIGRQLTTGRSCYPGDGYVDLVGLSAYITETILPRSEGDSYTPMLALGKPLIFSETGPTHYKLDGVTTQRDGTFDNRNIINLIKNSYPKIAAFMSWNSTGGYKMSIRTDANAQALVDDPMIITRDEVDW